LQFVIQSGRHEKSLVLFVHGIEGSSTTTWGAFPDLIRADGELSARYTIALDDYPTRKTGPPIRTHRGPGLCFGVE
jgi:hypothetical protein